jgi:hypothetical protein
MEFLTADAYSNVKIPRPPYKLVSILIIEKENIIETHTLNLEKKTVMNTAMNTELRFQHKFKIRVYVMLATINQVPRCPCKL